MSELLLVLRCMSIAQRYVMIDLLVKLCPSIAGILYAIVGIGYFIKKDYAWSLVWMSYALANLGLVLAAMKNSSG